MVSIDRRCIVGSAGGSSAYPCGPAARASGRAAEPLA